MKLRLMIAASLLVFVGCGNSERTAGTHEQIEEFSTHTFPRSFKGWVEYRERRLDPAEEIKYFEKSEFEPLVSDSVMGCLRTDGGRGFTVVMKNSTQDQLRIRIKDLHLRDSLSKYENLWNVTLDGHSRSRSDGGHEFRFNSRTQTNQIVGTSCRAGLQLNGNYVSGDIECPTVTPIDSDQQIALYVHLNCQVL